MDTNETIFIPDSLSEVEKGLLNKGLICFKKEDNGSTSLVMNLRHIVKTLNEEMGDIPLSHYIYKKIINNKREHPTTLKSMLISALSSSFLEYVSNGRFVEKMDKTQIKKVDPEEVFNYNMIIKRYYNLTPFKKPNTQDFIWFSPDKILYQELKENALKQEQSLFPGYEEWLSKGYSSPDTSIR